MLFAVSAVLLGVIGIFYVRRRSARKKQDRVTGADRVYSRDADQADRVQSATTRQRSTPLARNRWSDDERMTRRRRSG